MTVFVNVMCIWVDCTHLSSKTECDCQVVCTFMKHTVVCICFFFCFFWVSSGPGDEAKLFLWWHKALNLAAEQLQPQSGQTEVSGVVLGLMRLQSRLLQLGEERLNSGLLGAIGLGKRSPVSNR